MSISVPVLRRWAEDLEKSEQKSEVVERMMESTGWGRGKCYRELGKVGYESGRKIRSDVRKTMANEKALEQIAGLMLESVKKNGIRTMGLKTARSIVESNGIEIGVSDRQLRRLLKERLMDGESLGRENTWTRLKSLHPNHLHEVDPSLCVLYYTPGGEQKVLHASEVHRNKFEVTSKRMRGEKLWRYVLTDHYSGTVVCKYYEAKGETQSNLWDFLLYAWGKKGQEGYVVHGVPKKLMWDAGSANTSRAIQRALGMLGVESMTHMPGNPRAKGQVENANRLVEHHFESRLHREPAKSVEELNRSVEWFCMRWNNNTLSFYDSGMGRGDKKGLVRSRMWLGIKSEELRTLPGENICRGLLTHEAVKRKVLGDLSISYKHPRQRVRRLYDLRDVPGVYRDGYVEVMPLIMDEEAVMVSVEQLDGSVLKMEVKPIAFDEVGFAVDGAVIGEEYKSAKKSDVELVREMVENTAMEEIKSRSILEGGGYARFIHAGGSEIPVGGGAMDEERQSVVAVVRYFKDKYPAWWHDEVYDVLIKLYPQGMKEAEIRDEEEKIKEAGAGYKIIMLKAAGE